MTGAKIDHQPADQRAEGAANQQASGGGPDHVYCKPAPTRYTQVMQTQQAQTQHHEGKCGAVVEPALPGQAEAQAVAITGRFDLDRGGKHRVRRGENRAQQDGRARRQTESQHPHDGNHSDGQRHGHECQAQRQQPVPVRQGQAQLQADGKQRDQDRHLGYPLQKVGVDQWVDRSDRPPGMTQGKAGSQIEHGVT